jgi:hypothetical protein
MIKKIINLTEHPLKNISVSSPAPILSGGEALPEIPEIQIGKFRRGGHLIDNILKSNEPQPIQPTIFDNLLIDTKNKILSSGADLELINRRGDGIKLSKGEYKLLICLSKLLHNKSQNINTDKDDTYYSGNKGIDIINFKTPTGDIDLKSPKVSFTLYEITKEYYGELEIGGENVKTVAKLLYNLAEQPDKKVLIKYNRIVDLGKGVTREYYIERFDHLLQISTAGYKDMLNGKQIDEKKELIINLHPIFIDQIKNKYIEFPLDITKRMIEANGSPNISEITIKLVDELARAHSNRKILNKDLEQHPLYEIGKSRLYWKIAENYMSSKRVKLISQYVEKSIETAIKIGLLISFEIKKDKSGEPKYVFTLSKDWN